MAARTLAQQSIRQIGIGTRLVRNASILSGKSIDGACICHCREKHNCIMSVSIASYGLTSEQREFQSVALDFAENEMKPNMRRWDQEVVSQPLIT